MPSTRPARMLLALALALGCGRPAADSHPPDVPGAAPVPAEAEAAPMEEAEPVEEAAPVEAGALVEDAAPAGERTAAQTISFADDADPEPTTHIQGQPKRPPIPRFRLFGTRDGDGPN